MAAFEENGIKKIMDAGMEEMNRQKEAIDTMSVNSTSQQEKLFRLIAELNRAAQVAKIHQDVLNITWTQAKATQAHLEDIKVVIEQEINILKANTTEQGSKVDGLIQYIVTTLEN